MMRKYTLLLPAAALLIMFFFSCATVPRAPGKADVNRILALIDKGGADEAAGACSLPFLLDGEIMVLEKDVRMIWQNLHEAGFSLEGAAVLSTVPASAEQYSLFAGTMEVKTFFGKYVREKSLIAEVSAKSGRFLFLFTPAGKEGVRLQGMKGPLS